MSSNKRENPEQIPKEEDPQGKTGKVISEQAGVQGQRKEVNVESYSKVADVGQMLKDVEFPANKEKIIEHLKRQANIRGKEEILTEFQQKLKNREYKNVSDVTTTAGLVY
jgi:hypothetical protein